MNNASLAALCALALLGASPALAEPELDRALTAKIDADVTTIAAERHVNGLTLAIVRDGRLVYEHAYGWRDVAAKLPATLATKYEIGSITKQMTAAAVLQLVDQGRVSLDASLATYLPDAPHAREVTVRQLLSLTSGLPEYLPAPDHLSELLEPVSPEALVRRVGDKPLNYAPGAHWQHSNTNYLLLGRLIEKVSGEPYERYVFRHVLSRAPGARFGTIADEPKIAELSRGYANGKDGLYIDGSWVSAAGGLVGDVDDLVAWDTALTGGKVVSEASFQAMTTRQTPPGDPVGFGFAFFLDRHAGERRIWQDGSTLGFWGADQDYPDRRTRIIVLTNDANGGADALAQRVYDDLYGAASH